MAQEHLARPGRAAKATAPPSLLMTAVLGKLDEGWALVDIGGDAALILGGDPGPECRGFKSVHKSTFRGLFDRDLLEPYPRGARTAYRRKQQ